MKLKACLRWLNPIRLIGLTMLTWLWLASPYALAQEKTQQALFNFFQFNT